MMQAFKRRIYGSLKEMMADLAWPFKHREKLRQAMRGRLVSPQFRERLMMAVTAVNECRYCAFYHARESERVGLATNEIRELLAGDLAHAPEEELPALLYAQHYAEQNGRPDPITRQSLQTTYGPARADAIETVLRLIRMGNLLGNSTDWVLYKLSYGQLGGN
ncbi:MAG: carboxymuconolactone decarboxylase family protein [Ardenticatenaceae bacterium]|nr:carboxymuconolactone decarboxylase family protein [Anaerolineales bacterium]MCB8940556.1 carboxymuconolactone decarboxylase family protein [Ardenticatenaceae bacterium]MCB8973576.1 carboxymuconolactone decarboxylase family protein [Ardenticatenaceae bacterium]